MPRPHVSNLQSSHQQSHAQQQQLLRAKPSQSNKQYRELDSSVSAWWVDWDNTRCVGNCIGPPPCGDRNKGLWAPTYATIEECCEQLYGSLFEGVMLRECAEGGDATETPVASPSAHPSKVVGYYCLLFGYVLFIQFSKRFICHVLIQILVSYPICHM